MRRGLVLGAVVAALIAGILLATGALRGPGPTASGLPSPTRSAVRTPSPTPRPTPTPTPRPTPSPTPSPTPAPTATTFVSTDGYTITLPPQWAALAVDPEDVGPLLDLLGTQQPEVADLVRTYLDLSGARISMITLDNDPEHAGPGIPPNANILVQSSLGLPLDFVAAGVAEVIGRLPGVTTDVTRERVSLPAGDAIRMTFEVSTEGGTGPTGALVSYLIVRDGDAYVVTFVTLKEQLGRDGPVFDEMIRSLCFGTCP